MRSVTLALLALAVLIPSTASGIAISNIVCDPASEAAPQFGQHVNVSFSYTVDVAAGARIYVLPYSHGAITPHSSNSGSPLYAQGSGGGSSWFSVDTGEALVDDLCC